MVCALVNDAKNALKRYHAVLDKARNLDLPKKYYLESIPKVHALKMADVNAINTGRVLSLIVIEPQDYSKITILNRKDESIVEGFFYERNKLAVTGSGADRWIKLRKSFVEWLEKRTSQLEKRIQSRHANPLQMRRRMAASRQAGRALSLEQMNMEYNRMIKDAGIAPTSDTTPPTASRS